MASTEKILIYQVLPRLFGNRNVTNKVNGTIVENGCGKFRDFDAKTLRRIREMGFTHVWYTGVIRHATKTDYSRYGVPRQHPAVVKGNAGSPYAIVDYYDVDPDLAVDVENRMGEWDALIERTHRAGLKVVMDFVPNHVAREYQSIAKPKGIDDLGAHDDAAKHFSTKNNFYYCWGQPFEPLFDVGDYKEAPAKATGNDRFDSHPGRDDWYETVKLNYGIDYCDAGGRSEHFSPEPDTWLKMSEILRFWASKGIDGFRCDMAEMVPTAFWTYAIEAVKKRFLDILFIGEVYNPGLYRAYLKAGFDFLYDKVGMYDCLRNVVCHRRPASDITRQWQAVDDIRAHMLYFLENHDEQRIASGFFVGSARAAMPAIAVSLLMGTNPYMHYAGQEYGECGMDAEGFSGHDGRTTIFDYWCLDTVRRGFFDRRQLRPDERQLERQYRQLLGIAKEPAVADGQFFDLQYANLRVPGYDANRQYAFLRKTDTCLLLVVANFSPVATRCQVVIPGHAFDCLRLPVRNLPAIDLLRGTSFQLRLSPDEPVEVQLPSYGASICKICW